MLKLSYLIVVLLIYFVELAFAIPGDSNQSSQPDQEYTVIYDRHETKTMEESDSVERSSKDNWFPFQEEKKGFMTEIPRRGGGYFN